MLRQMGQHHGAGHRTLFAFEHGVVDDLVQFHITETSRLVFQRLVYALAHLPQLVHILGDHGAELGIGMGAAGHVGQPDFVHGQQMIEAGQDRHQQGRAFFSDLFRRQIQH